jgi:hypothetical protein
MVGQQGSSEGFSGNTEGGSGEGSSNVDVNALLEDFRSQMAEPLQQSQREVGELRQQGQKTQQILDKMKKVLNGDEDAAAVVDPIDQQISHLQGQVDNYIAAAIEAERRGRPIPLTVNAALESFQGQISTLKQMKGLISSNKELAQKVDRFANPSAQIDNMAFSSLDSAVMNALNTVYGEGEDMQGVKEAQFKSITSLIGKEIRDLKENDPEIWDRIRRNPTDQKKLVAHFTKQVIPPRARQLLEEEQIKNTPLTLSDLKQAWEETADIEDPRARKEIRDQLRPQILEHVWSKSRKGGGGGRARVNDVF